MNTSDIQKLWMRDPHEDNKLNLHATLDGTHTLCLREIKELLNYSPNNYPVDCERCLLVFGAALR